MASKPRISRDDIVNVAFEIVRRHGWAGLMARAIAKELNCSTMPIYSHFASLEGVEEAVVKKALELLFKYQTTPRTGRPLLDISVGYVLFSRDEPHLFQAINDDKHSGYQTKYGDENFDLHVDSISRDPRLKGLSHEDLRYLVFLQWIYIHGLASLSNWARVKDIGEEKLIEYLRNGTKAIMVGFLEMQKKKKS